jgi:hypothetical protein
MPVNHVIADEVSLGHHTWEAAGNLLLEKIKSFN